MEMFFIEGQQDHEVSEAWTHSSASAPTLRLLCCDICSMAHMHCTRSNDDILQSCSCSAQPAQLPGESSGPYRDNSDLAFKRHFDN